MNNIYLNRFKSASLLYAQIQANQIKGPDLCDVKDFWAAKSKTLLSFVKNCEENNAMEGIKIYALEEYSFTYSSLGRRVIHDLVQNKIYEFEPQKSMEYLNWELSCNIFRQPYLAINLWYNPLLKSLQGNNRGSLNLFSWIDSSTISSLINIVLLDFVCREPLWQQNKNLLSSRNQSYKHLSYALGDGILLWLEVVYPLGKDIQNQSEKEMEDLTFWWKNFIPQNKQSKEIFQKKFPGREYPENALSLWTLAREILAFNSKDEEISPEEAWKRKSFLHSWFQETSFALGQEIIQGMQSLGYWRVINLSQKRDFKKWNTQIMVEVPISEIQSSWFLSLPRPSLAEAETIHYKWTFAIFIQKIWEETGRRLSSRQRNAEYIICGDNRQANFHQKHCALSVDTEVLTEISKFIFDSDTNQLLLPYYEIPDDYQNFTQGLKLVEDTLDYTHLDLDVKTELKGLERVTDGIKNRRYQLVHAWKASLCLLTEVHFSLPGLISKNGRFSFRGSLVNPQGSTFQRLFLCFSWVDPAVCRLMGGESAVIIDLLQDLKAKTGSRFTELFVAEVNNFADDMDVMAFFWEKRNEISFPKRRKALRAIPQMLAWKKFHSKNEQVRVPYPSCMIFWDAPTSVYQIQGLLLDSPGLGLATGLYEDGQEFKGFYQRIIDGIELNILDPLYSLFQESQDFSWGPYAPDVSLNWSLKTWKLRAEKNVFMLDDLARKKCAFLGQKFHPIIKLFATELPDPWAVLSTMHFVLELFLREDKDFWLNFSRNIKISKSIAMPLSYGITDFRMVKNIQEIRDKEEISELIDIIPTGSKERQNFMLVKIFLMSVDFLYPEIREYARFFEKLGFYLEKNNSILHWKTPLFEWFFSMPKRKILRIKIPGHSLQIYRDIEGTFDRKAYMRKILASTVQCMDASLIFNCFATNFRFDSHRCPLVPLYDSLGTVPGSSAYVRGIYLHALKTLRKDNPLFLLAKKYNIEGPWKLKQKYLLLSEEKLTNERVLRC